MGQQTNNNEGSLGLGLRGGQTTTGKTQVGTLKPGKNTGITKCSKCGQNDNSGSLHMGVRGNS